MATYIFTGMFCVGAETEDQARDGLMELLNELVGRDDSDPFVLEEVIEEEEQTNDREETL